MSDNPTELFIRPKRSYNSSHNLVQQWNYIDDQFAEDIRIYLFSIVIQQDLLN